VLKNLDVYAKREFIFKGYLKKHHNLKVHSYGEDKQEQRLLIVIFMIVISMPKQDKLYLLFM
jgi:hypothetical protein